MPSNPSIDPAVRHRRARRRAAVASLTALALVGAIAAAAAAQSPDPAPSTSPSAAPSPAASASTSPGLPVSLGASVPMLKKVFTASAGWVPLDAKEATVELSKGAIRIRLKTDNQNRWTWATLPASTPVMRMEVTADMTSGTNAAGPMCGSGTGQTSFIAGVVDLTEWALIRIVGDQLSLIGRAQVPGLDLQQGGTVKLALECAVTPEGTTRVLFSVGGQTVADVTDELALGAIDKMGLYASTAVSPFRVRFHDATVQGGDAYDPRLADGSAPAPTPIPAPDASPPPSAAASPAGRQEAPASASPGV